MVNDTHTRKRRRRRSHIIINYVLNSSKYSTQSSECALCVFAKELAQLLKRVDAEISNCESCHHDEIEKRKKYKVRDRVIWQLLGSFWWHTVFTASLPH